ncbi:MAG: ATP synthase F1 subunit epsilon [Planctomycetes bacterium]|nr:ATP synthase F1 subunit epsilon [Planctomycetota bacterium]
MRLLVITPEKVVLDREVDSVRIPGTEGSFGVLSHHAPLLAAVEPGELTVTEKGGNHTSFFVADGFVEVGKNVVRLVVDSGEPVTDIDLKRAEESEKRARERLAARVKTDIDLPRAEGALRRALQRTKLARKYRM